MESARIHVNRRPGGYVDRARAYKVLVDGEEKGRIKAGESVTADVAPGRHEVHLGIDWARSPTLAVDVQPGEQVTLHCRPNANPFNMLWYISGGRKNYIGLEREAG